MVKNGLFSYIGFQGIFKGLSKGPEWDLLNDLPDLAAFLFSAHSGFYQKGSKMVKNGLFSYIGFQRVKINVY
jgi:hypothetical protein